MWMTPFMLVVTAARLPVHDSERARQGHGRRVREGRQITKGMDPMDPMDEMKTYQDIGRTCVGCGVAYTWSVRDQRYAELRGFLPPRRCGLCREFLRQRREQSASDA
jgi:hypothetical protein